MRPGRTPRPAGLRGLLRPPLAAALRLGGGAAAAPFQGILDRLATPAAGAWSVARVLRTAWLEQPLIRLRRLSDNAESDFGADEKGDLDAAAIAAWTGGSGAAVKLVYDQSGAGNDWEQPTPGIQPAYSATVVNGLPGFDNPGSRIINIPAAAATNNVWTVGGSLHFVWGPTSSLVNQKYLNKGFGAAGAWDFVGSGDAAPNTKARLRIAGATSGTLGPTSGTTRVSGSVYVETLAVGSALNIAACAWRANGAAETVASGGDNIVGGAKDDSAVAIACPTFGALTFVGGEFIIFKAALSSGDLQSLNDNATDYYGLD